MTEARDVLNALDDGPLSHREICDRVGLTWAELQTVIRDLRTAGEVVITLDRRYELAEGDVRGSDGGDA